MDPSKSENMNENRLETMSTQVNQFGFDLRSIQIWVQWWRNITNWISIKRNNRLGYFWNDQFPIATSNYIGSNSSTWNGNRLMDLLGNIEYMSLVSISERKVNKFWNFPFILSNVLNVKTTTTTKLYGHVPDNCHKFVLELMWNNGQRLRIGLVDWCQESTIANILWKLVNFCTKPKCLSFLFFIFGLF